ncbi:AMP-binding protein [Nocardia paucivorans]|uniref:AMP-binding protein n=1 Tax=Nocardia paucivorans TaxID=114259 RepID=UPI00031826D0|nr:AMP-binding protein [Nocardia paucivorans]
MTVVDDIRSVGRIAEPKLLPRDRERVLGEWSIGVEPCDVPALATVIRHGHAVPGSRIAARVGDEVLTYGELFGAKDHRRRSPVSDIGPCGDALVGLLAEFVAAVRAGGGRFGDRGLLLGLDALAVAVADRRCVAADRRPCRIDPALRPADVRLLALPWGEAQNSVDLIAAWSAGATVIVPTETQRRDPLALAGLVERYAVTQVVAEVETPIRLVTAGSGRLPTVARWDLVGIRGGAELSAALRTLTPEAVATFALHVPAYLGPVTRGAVAATGWTRPVPGAKALILDPELRPVPPGVAGQIYVGGCALAEGFADGGDRHRFLDDPFEPGGRLFRSGHRAWWTSEGRLIVES